MTQLHPTTGTPHQLNLQVYPQSLFLDRWSKTSRVNHISEVFSVLKQVRHLKNTLEFGSEI